MTWVVGGATPVGQAFLVGDTRVTFGEKGPEADLIRKVYWVGRDMAAGFSGSVTIGFALVADLRARLLSNDASVVRKPEVIARYWARHAAELFRSFSDDEQVLGAGILIAGVAPRNNGPFAHTVLIKMRAPSFKPEWQFRYGALQIGTGTKHETYKRWLEQYFEEPHVALNFASWGTMLGSVIASSLSSKVAEDPIPGVSKYMHVVSCGRGVVSEAQIPQVNPWEDIPDPFPKVASTYAEFLEMAGARGYIAGGASA